MANDIFSSVGTKISVDDAAPATITEAGFAALTFALVGEASEVPAFGAEAALATHTPLATGVVNKRRGSVNYGSVTIPMALSETDLGQAILKAAGLADPGMSSQVSVKVELANGDVLYFTAEVMSFRTNIGNADAISMAEVTLELNSKVVYAIAP